MFPVLQGWEGYRLAIDPTGEWAARLIIVAMAITPLRVLFPHAPSVLWLQRRRRVIGLAAFGYASLHLVAFTLSIGRLDYIVQGLAFASMWTGWLAFLLLAPLAATSSDAAVRLLGRGWKMLQRLVYPAALLTLAHWLLLTKGPQEALLHAAPLATLQLFRVCAGLRDRWSRRGALV